MNKIIAGNFKMNKTIKECMEYAIKFSGYKLPKNRDVILCPPAYALDIFSKTLKKYCKIGCQNIGAREQGALTGELSASMIKSAGVTFALVGHSERRHIIGETDEDINKKAILLQNQDITPIICIGETLEQSSKKKAVLGAQISKAIKGLNKDFIIAYEPVWAIGTGKTCDTDTISKTHEYIKEKVLKLTGRDVPVLYGGSVKTNNAKLILNTKNVDGVLVGGACLDPEEFYKIVIA